MDKLKQLAHEVSAALHENLDSGSQAKAADESGRIFVFFKVSRDTSQLKVIINDGTDDKTDLTFFYDNWLDDFGLLTERKMLLWCELLVKLILESESAGKYNQLILFNWNGMAVASNAFTLASRKHAIKQSEILSEVFVKTTTNAGVMMFSSRWIVFVSGPLSIVYFDHKSVTSIALDYGELMILTEDGSYQYKELYYESEERFGKGFKQDYFDTCWVTVGDLYKAGKFDEIVSRKDSVIANRKWIELKYLMIAEYKCSAYGASIEVSKLLLDMNPGDLEILDAIFPAYLRSGDYQGVLQIVKSSAVYLINKSSMYACNLLANAINAFGALKKYDDLALFVNDYYAPDNKCANRLYYHNFACAFALLGDIEKAKEAIEQSIFYGETWEKISNESDFSNILGDESYATSLKDAIASLPGSKKRVQQYGVDDLGYMIRTFETSKQPDSFLITIAAVGNPHCEVFLEDIMNSSNADEERRIYAFFGLIVSGSPHALAAAKAFYAANKDAFEFDIFFFEDVYSKVGNMTAFRADLLAVMPDETGQSLVEATEE